MFEYPLMFLALCVFGWLHRSEECVMRARSVRLVITDTGTRSAETGAADDCRIDLGTVAE